MIFADIRNKIEDRFHELKQDKNTRWAFFFIKTGEFEVRTTVYKGNPTYILTISYNCIICDVVVLNSEIMIPMDGLFSNQEDFVPNNIFERTKKEINLFDDRYCFDLVMKHMADCNSENVENALEPMIRKIRVESF